MIVGSIVVHAVALFAGVALAPRAVRAEPRAAERFIDVAVDEIRAAADAGAGAAGRARAA